jgi:hypothetical protein
MLDFAYCFTDAFRYATLFVDEQAQQKEQMEQRPLPQRHVRITALLRYWLIAKLSPALIDNDSLFTGPS